MQRCKVLLRSLWCFGQKDGGDSLGSEKGGRLFPVSGAEVALNSITFAEQVCVRVCVRECPRAFQHARVCSRHNLAHCRGAGKEFLSCVCVRV